MTNKKNTDTKPAAKSATTKRARLIALLERERGATLNEMVGVTNWLPHTIRAALTGLRKAGLALESDKVEGVRRYKITAGSGVTQ